MSANSRYVVVGAGFTGLSAAFELASRGCSVTLVEVEKELGGLASGFPVGETRLERFYHHWFTSDRYVMNLVEEIGEQDKVEYHPAMTGMYFANRLYRLASPMDLLRFTPLSFVNRLRLGFSVLRARKPQDWDELDRVSAAQWVRDTAGEQVYRVVWEPLLRGKFGEYAEQVSAAWLCSKLKLRGGSRGKQGKEVLAYFRGGFAALAASLGEAIVANGGEVWSDCRVSGLISENGKLSGVATSKGELPCEAAVLTPGLNIIADLMEGHVGDNYVRQLRSVEYLANVCLILVLERSLSDLYWMNVNDLSFPFVGIIEHTNFEPPESYAGKHIVYLSKYLPRTSDMYRMNDAELLAFALPHIKRMFPDFREEWISDHFVWRAAEAQPLVTCGYAAKVPEPRTPLEGCYISTMAQIYPEDRGTNYSIRDGRAVGRLVAGSHVNKD